MDFYQEITTAVEKGFFKQLNSSIKYSPLKFFIHLFMNKNPQLINNARQYFRDDLANLLQEMPNFNLAAFTTNQALTDPGKHVLQQSYNLGIYVLKEKLTVKTAFQVITNPDFRYQIYIFTLGSVENIINSIVEK